MAATLAGMLYSLGGKRMAIYVAELARAGMTPDWLPGVMPRSRQSRPRVTSMASGRPLSRLARNA